MLSTQLRLEVAELTDVGRRRDSNEDNLTRLVPKDPRLMERKGAIFVVADGMGGHAAGEVASEIAVETIREEYYESPAEDVVEALQHAIKQANQVIYERATEQAGRAGMGTTCVVLVMRGSLAYIANVGDSRAYLIRDGQLRQITNDHSWVAEQVRAGMLTDAQARTHAHRNVITRALGTQPEVEADLFIEPLRSGDLLLLCSDGLSGPVSDAELSRIVTSLPPQEAVHELIAQANEQGGPDNITAILVHVLEAPPLEPETQEQLAMLTDATKEPSVPLKLPKKPRKRRSPVTLALRLFAAVAVLFISLAIWDYGFGPLAWERAAHNQASVDVVRARQLVTQAKNQPPDKAINTLAAAQHPLLSDLQNRWLSGDDRQQVTATLQHMLAPAIRDALKQYNTLALVKPLSTLTSQRITVSCKAAPGGQLDRVVAVAPGSAPAGKGGGSSSEAPLFFGRVHSTTIASAVYLLTPQGVGESVTCGDVIDPSVVDLTVDGSTLYLLHEGSAQGSAAAPFSIEQIVVTPGGKMQPQPLLTLPAGPGNAQPVSLAIRGSQKYVLYRGASDSIYRCPDTTTSNCRLVGPATLPVQARSLAIGPNSTLYLLLVNGSVAALEGNTLHALNLSVLPALPVTDPASFNVLTPLPTVPAIPTFSASAAGTPAPGGAGTSGSSSTPTAGAGYTPVGVKLANATLLVSDQQNRLFIGDGTDYRILRLNPPTTRSDDPAVSEQYSDPSALESLLSLSVLDNGAPGFSLYALCGHTLLVLTLS